MSDPQVTLGITRIVATITYAKDALFAAFEYRVWQAGQNKEDAVIRSAQGYSLGSDQYEVQVYETRGETAGTVWYVEARVRNTDDQPSGWTQGQVTVPGNPVTIDAEGARRGSVGIGPDGNPIIDDIPAIKGQQRQRELFSGDGSPGGHKGPSGSGDTERVPAGDVEIGDGADTRRPLKEFLDVTPGGDPQVRGETLIDTDAATDVRDGSARGRTGLDATGDVQRGVPRAYAADELPGISATSGKVKRSETTDEGVTLESETGAQGRADAAEDAANAETTGRGLDAAGDFSGTVDGDAASDVKDGAGRARGGLSVTGEVASAVPLAYVAANVPGISAATGKVKKTVAYDEGGDPEDTAGAAAKAAAAQSAAEATASGDATTKANTAQANAEATADADATLKADVAEETAIVTAKA
ncbi:MAG TPA: hypothetical protein VMW94_05895, partial [Actinomycetes bacterium]|nr:hypothetical protein [Actinomycetes bacterium]